MTFRRQRREQEMLRRLRNLFRDERGQDMIEYGLLGSLISVAALVVIKLIGPLIVPLYEAIEAALTI
jgi:Flp pilus assembly pilin Flp